MLWSYSFFLPPNFWLRILKARRTWWRKYHKSKYSFLEALWLCLLWQISVNSQAAKRVPSDTALFTISPEDLRSWSGKGIMCHGMDLGPLFWLSWSQCNIEERTMSIQLTFLSKSYVNINDEYMNINIWI